MGFEIVPLWWWDPLPDLIEEWEKIRLQKNAPNQHDDPRSAKLYPIHHHQIHNQAAHYTWHSSTKL